MRLCAKSIVAAVVLWPGGYAGGEAVVVSEAECRLLERHAPSVDVAYKPGVDVRGAPVAPADAAPHGRIATPQQVALDVSLPLRALLFDPPRRLADAEVQVGQLVVDLADGQLHFNGQPLSDPVLAQFVAACRARKAR